MWRIDLSLQKHVIVLEEEVVLAPDFLNFLAQCLDAVETDETLIGVSAWNDNGELTRTRAGVFLCPPALVILGPNFPQSWFLSEFR